MTRRRPGALWHWTCEHAWRDILAGGPWVLRPWLQPSPSGQLNGRWLLWLTDRDSLPGGLHSPEAAELGLTSAFITCDRTAFRFEVRGGELGAAEPWTAWAHRNHLGLQDREWLEAAPGAAPRRWWVSEQPLRATSWERRGRVTEWSAHGSEGRVG